MAFVWHDSSIVFAKAFASDKGPSDKDLSTALEFEPATFPTGVNVQVVSGVAVDVPGGRVAVTVTPTTTVLEGPAVLVAAGELDPRWLEQALDAPTPVLPTLEIAVVGSPA